MAVYIDVKSRFDDTSGRKAAEEAKRYFANAGTSSGDGFMGNFARAVEKDTKVRAAADKVAGSVDKITAAEAKRATQMERSKAITEAIGKAENDLAKLRGIDHVRATEAAMAVEKQLADLKAKQVDVDNKLIASSAAVSTAERARAAATREATQAYRDMGKDVDGLGTKLANLGSVGGALKLNLGLAALGTLPAAATAITEVAGALQQLAGAGFAVPGIFAGIAASVGVGALGMYGMTDAIKAVDKASDGTKASVEAANEAMAKLPASSADVVRTVVGLKGTLTDLSTVASTNMFDGFSAGLKGLAAADLPAITRGVDGISRGINENLLQAMNSLGSSSSQGFLDRIFGNTASAQSKLTAAIDPIVHAVGALSAAGSDTLPRLADAVGAVADRFDRFISAADASGNLKKWIDEGLDGFTQLGNTVLNIGKSFTGLTEAAGGGAGLLGTLESATGKMSAFLNSTEGQTKLKEFFAEGRDMLGQLKDVATAAGPVLAGVFRAGITEAGLWLPVIKDILTTINAIPGGATAVVSAFVAWKTMTGIASLAQSLGNIGNQLGGLPGKATAAGGAMNSALTLAGPIAAAFALQTAYDGVLNKINQITGTKIATNIDSAIGPGNAIPFAYNQVTGNPQMDAAQAQRQAALDAARAAGPPPSTGTPYDPFAVAGIPRPGTRGVGGVARPDGPWNSTPSVGVSGFTAPVITEAPKGGAAATPYIDPSKYAMGDPLAGLPGAVAGADPTKIYDADSKVISAAHNVEQQRLANQVLEAKGNATQAEILAAKFDLQEKERALYDAQNDDIKARTNQMKQSTSDLKDVFTPLDQGFGISGGIPGIVENLTKMFGNIALAGAISQSPSLQAGAAQLAANGGVAPGLFNQQYFTGSSSGYASSGSAYYPGASPGGSYGLPGGTNTGGYGSGGKGVFPDWVQQVGAAFGVTPSTYSGHQETDRHEAGYAPNPNHENRGIDWTGSPQAMQKFADYLRTVPGMEQVIWNGGGQGTGDTVEIAGGRSQPGYFAGDLAGHGNHVHTRQSSPIPLPGGYGGDGYSPPAAGGVPMAPPLSVSSAGTGGTQSVFVVNMPGGGFIGGPGGFAPGAADPSAFGPTPLGGGVGPNLVPPVSTGIGTGPAPGPTGWGAGGLPTAGGGGQGFGAGLTPGMAGQGAGIGTGVTSPGGAGGGGGGGLGIPQGLMGGAMGAASALDLMMPGAGQAAQVGLKVADRTIKFAGESAGIIAQGAIDTWLPAGSALAGNSWFSKLLGGLSGAKAAKPNNAGGQGGQPQQAPPMGSPASGQGAGPAPGPGGDTNITVNNQRATEDGTGRDIAFHQQAAHMGPGN